MRISDWSSDVCSSDLSSTNFSLSLSKLLRTLLLRLGTYAIGNFNPCSFAQAFAISYPASACRITPVPGSFHSTRAMRLSAASVPSQTMTRSEEHTSQLQSLMRISYPVFCLQNNKLINRTHP